LKKTNIMKNIWQPIQTSYNNNQLISSINDLLIHLKLSKLGLDSKIPGEEIEQAKIEIKEFLNLLKPYLRKKQSSNKILPIGIDRNTKEIIKNFSDAQNDLELANSPLFNQSFDSLKALLKKSNLSGNEPELLIQTLTSLGNILEEQQHTNLNNLSEDI